MEFEELQKAWDSQNNRMLYALDEKALYNRILSKKQQAHHLAAFSELLLIAVNIGAAGFIIGITFFEKRGGVFAWLMPAWMLLTAAYVVVVRVRRINASNRFDRSMLGDLHNAIAIATHQVRLSQLMRLNVVPIGALAAFGVWEGGKPFWITVLILAFFALTYVASGWEHNIYRRKKVELEQLKCKLEDESTIA